MPPRPPPTVLRCAIALAIALTAARSRGEPPAPPDRFRKAMSLRDEGRCAEAIAVFEESRRAAPGPGKDFYLADCLEATGQLKGAWSLFVDVVAAAEALGKKPLERDARARAAALDARIPRLTVIVSPEVRGLPELSIQLDGKPLQVVTWNKPLPVDPGRHSIAASAPSRSRVEIEASLTLAPVAVTIPMLERVTPPPTPAAPAPLVLVPPPPVAPATALPPAPRQGLSGPRIAAVGLAGAAVVGGLIGSVTGALAFGKDADWVRETQASCTPKGDCNSPSDVARIQAIEAERSRLATASTVGFVAGGACLAGAAVLWLLSPSGGPRLVPQAPGATAGLSIAGSF